MKSRAFAVLVLALVATHASVASAARFPAQRGLANPFPRGHVTSDTQISAGIEAQLASAAAAAGSADLIKKPFNAFKHMPGHDVREKVESPLPVTYVPKHKVPRSFTWSNVKGVNYLTKMLNQHVPQYCGSCWAHGAISALGDRIKIARGAKGIDVNLAVQHMLNCGNAGSCHGGSVDGPYQWIHQISKATGTGIAYETENPYLACSSESNAGICGAASWKCTPENVARTCSTFPSMGGTCTGLSQYPNATISDYGSISGPDAMAKEIYNRGPISCGIDAAPILKYAGGVVDMAGESVDHVISVVGWGTDTTAKTDANPDGAYWIVRNSWGEFWGEMGYIRVAKGNNALHLEDQCAWAVPDVFTAGNPSFGTGPAGNFPCDEDGGNCKATA